MSDFNDVIQDVMRGIFWPLGLFSVISAVTLWRLVAWPAIKSGEVWRYAIGVGGSLISFALAWECVTYGLVRWLPHEMAWVGNVYMWVLAPKLIYLVGIMMIETAHVTEDRRRTRLLRLSMLAMILCSVGAAVAAVWFE